MNTIDIIIKYGLSIRQIPQWRHRTLDRSEAQEGDELRERELTPAAYRYMMKHPQYHHLHRIDAEAGRAWRLYAIRTIPVTDGGGWMCQQVHDTSSRVEWDKKRHHLAPTLEESVALFYESRKQ